MIKIKHLMDAVEGDDGRRLWIEPIRLTRDLGEWCQVSQSCTHLGPPKALCAWFEEHPEGWEYFRGRYHQILSRGEHDGELRQLIRLSQHQNITLLHQGGDPSHNTATALYEFLSELSAYCPPEP